jgi:hypothetical protein
MTKAEQSVVVGTFEDRKAVVSAFEALLKAGFQEDQLGFVARAHEEHAAYAQHHIKHGYGARAVTRGILGGILGAADILLVPFIGPTDASNMFAVALPVTEEVLNHLPYPGSRDAQKPLARPDDALRAGEHAPLTEDAGSQSVADEAATVETSESENAEAKHLIHEERESAMAGGVVGGALGAVAAALVLPGIGFVVAGGIVAAAVGGSAAGSVAGSFLGTLTELGVPHEAARHYEHEVKSGRTIVTVKDTSRQQDVITILRQQGATDVQAH